MRFLTTLMAVVALAVAPVYAQQADIAAIANASVFFYSASPLGAARIASATTLGANVTAESATELQGATHVELWLGARAWIFEVAKLPAAGQAVADTEVKLNGSTTTLRAAAVQISAALASKGNLAVFTNGMRGVIVSIVQIGAASTLTASPMTVQATGATHVELLVAGHSRHYKIVTLGTTMNAIVVTAVTITPSEDRDLPQLTLLDVLIDLL